jgi:hypothetical protein
VLRLVIWETIFRRKNETNSRSSSGGDGGRKPQ